jgi:hypothetical protein
MDAGIEIDCKRLNEHPGSWISSYFDSILNGLNGDMQLEDQFGYSTETAVGIAIGIKPAQ